MKIINLDFSNCNNNGEYVVVKPSNLVDGTILDGLYTISGDGKSDCVIITSY